KVLDVCGGAGRLNRDNARKKSKIFKKSALLPYKRSYGKIVRHCIVCGKPRPMRQHERMCAHCRSLTPQERRYNCTARRKHHSNSAHTVSGGLSSLGKRGSVNSCGSIRK